MNQQEFQKLKEDMYRYALKNAEMINGCRDIDALICALYACSKISIADFGIAKKHAINKQEVYKFCTGLNNYASEVEAL